MSVKNIRLFIFDTKINKDQEIILGKDQSHYIAKVMRARVGERFRVFNDRKQEWEVEIVDSHKNSVKILPIKPLRILEINNETGRIKLYFAPIKNQKLLNLMIEKVVEIGVDEIQPIITDFTNNRSLNEEKLTSHIIEAAEQSEQLSVPLLLPQKSLMDIIKEKDINESMFICFEESSKENHLLRILENDNKTQNIKTLSVVIGPEGGFSPKEIELFNKLKVEDNFHMVSLGESILRAETAAIVSCYTLKSHVDMGLFK